MSRKYNVLITGGAGYLGAYIAEQLLREDLIADRLVIYSRDELKHFHAGIKLQKWEEKISFVLGDIRDSSRLKSSLNEIDVLIHAAALKQVATCEQNPGECFHTNVKGTENVIEACQEAQVSKLIFISTDKAVDPISTYGNAKQAGEKLVLSAGNDQLSSAVIRLGNLIGSPGSIGDMLHTYPEKQVTLFDEEATRFIGSMENAWQLIKTSILEAYPSSILIPKLRSQLVSEIIKDFGPQVRVVKGEKRTFEKSHEVLASENELSRMLEKDSYYIIPPKKMVLDEAIEVFHAVPAGLQSYSSQDLLIDFKKV